MATLCTFRQYLKNSILRITFLSKRSAVTGFMNEAHVSVYSKSDSEELRKVEELMSGNMLVYNNFINEKEEVMLYEEVRPSLEKRSYQHEHWDDVSTL